MPSKKIFLCVCIKWRLTKERKNTAEIYAKNKIHTIRVSKKGANDPYIIWVKMIDLQKGLVHQNLCYAAMKKIRSYCKTKYSTKEQVKKYKRKIGKWINDNKSAYLCEILLII